MEADPTFSKTASSSSGRRPPRDRLRRPDDALSLVLSVERLRAALLASEPERPARSSGGRAFTIISRKRTTTFDIRKATRLMADRDPFFEIGPLWGTDQVTGFVRFDGRPLGVIASDSRLGLTASPPCRAPA
jgi:acetyl-CoA carboxylase carboxyltransferase component